MWNRWRAYGVGLLLWPLACSGSDDDGSGSESNGGQSTQYDTPPGVRAVPCEDWADPCAQCTCRQCLCDAICQEGVDDVGMCFGQCFDDESTPFETCMDSCEANASPEAQANLRCTKQVVSGVCATSCGL